MNLPTRLDYPIIAVGDLHGRCDWLTKLVTKLRQHPVWPHAKLAFLGDLVDRGPNVRETVQLVMDLLAEKPGSTCVAGNHDWALVRAAGLNGPPSERWQKHYRDRYDHYRTFESYLGTGFPIGRNGWTANLELLKGAMPAEHREFLAELPWVAESDGHVFVHNGLSPYLDEPAEVQLELLRRKRWDGYVTPKLGSGTHLHYNPEYPVWLGADKTLSKHTIPAPGRVIVSGHVRVDEPDVNPIRIRIDTSGGIDPPLTACILTSPSSQPEFVFSE
ncbi:metallophosphoesterase [Limnoglobus roseus]|uniref:metallophosphoesterase n=1 Tax=Limnoglobus roseus TaxID=2598579 RepID=UPI00143CED13|nr:metallophosphoesterase [Limnoglobus roseus]